MSQKLLNKSPKVLVAELIQAANPDFDFNFDAIDITDVAENGNHAYNRNTRAKVSPSATVTPALYRESSYVWYDRIPIQDFFLGIEPKLAIDAGVKTTHDLIPLIQSTYGIVIDQDSCVDSPIVRGDTYPFPHVVELKTTGLAWTGSVTFYLLDGTRDIAGMMKTTVMAGLNFPYYTANRIQALVYSYAIDCTAIRSDLAGLKVGSNLSAMVSLFNNVAPTPWVYNGREDENNLYGATVLATGKTTELIAQGYPVNPAFANAVIVTLSQDYCTNYGGILLMQYN